MTLELKKILLIDDEEDIRLVARFALEGLGGFEVVECSSGEEALTLVDEVGAQLILLDHLMPGLDGMATLSRLREAMGSRVPPVIFLTGKSEESEHERYRAAGALAIIVKPFDPLSLAEVIQQAWQLRPS